MLNEGIVVSSITLNDDEYCLKLKQKLLEEAEEVSVAESLESLKIELADVLEVIHAIADHSKLSFLEIEKERLEKRSINGHFSADTYIHYIEVSKDNKKVINYLMDRNRHYKVLKNH